MVAQEQSETKIKGGKMPTLEEITKSVEIATDRLGHRQNTRIEEEMRRVAKEGHSLTWMTDKAEMLVSLTKDEVAR